MRGFLGLVFCISAYAQQQCATCHADVYAKFQQTGMGRSFFKPSPANTIEDYARNNHYFHQASAIHYAMLQRSGEYFQKRFQIGLNGEEINSVEERVDYVLGSGNHARSYLHRTPQGTLVQLPLGWYAEKGGYWAMSPGYDMPGHAGSQRVIGNDCMFCHNAYPPAPAGKERFADPPAFPAQLPQGIDCQRCHGPLQKHAVSPAKFSVERRMEVCMQCHLEPDSLNPALNLKRYGRDWFSYQPGEPLSDFMLFFATAPEDPAKFQIAGTAYEFRKSACFLKSAGKLECTTCHDPHEEKHGVQEIARYDAICANCHTAPPNHAARTECVGCHMPKRRTTDVVHVAMTDHYIRRRPLAGDLLADMTEDHQAARPSRSSLYYPAGKSEPLYAAMARVRNNEGTAQAVAAHPPSADAWYEIAEAERRAGHAQAAINAYRSCLARDPKYASAQLGLGEALLDSKQPALARGAFARATQIAPDNTAAWTSLGRAQMGLNAAAAEISLRKAASLDSTLPDPHNWLGILAAQRGDTKAAEEEFRAAIRLQSNSAGPHANLANLLAMEGYAALAATEFDSAVLYKPEETATRMSYAALLTRLARYKDAAIQLEAVVENRPDAAEAHNLLGNTLEREGDRKRALAEYKEAARLKPRELKFQLDLGAVLLAGGDQAAALPHLRLAAGSRDQPLREMALRLLEGIRASTAR